MIAEDIVQNVFLKLFENLELLKDKNSVSAWIYKATRNEIYETLRKRKRKPEHDEGLAELSSETNVAVEYETKELKKLIADELDSMPEEQREVYVLKEYSELSYQEIAGVLGIEEGLVKSRLFKVRQKLLKRLAKLV